MENCLECRDLCKSYAPWSGGFSHGTAALDHVNLTLKKGKVIGLLGPNGSGKTTLIKLAAGLLKPSAGELLVCDATPGEVTKGFVSYLPERTYFTPSLTVRDTLELFESFYEDFDSARAQEMLERLHIPMGQKFKALSKGNKEKVQLVLVMARQAMLYLLDEPIGGVDPATRDYILDTIVSNYAEDSTVLISTHLIADVEKVLDEFVFLKEGQIVLHSTSDEVREQFGMSVDEYFREVFKC